VELSQSAGLAKFEDLRGKLESAEQNAFGAKTPAGLKRKRELLLRAISSDRSSRLQIGQLAARYRDHYKAEQAWMPLGQFIARALGYRSYSSLNQLMRTAVRALKLPKNLLAAVIEEGIDPAESKYKSILDELILLAFSGTDEEARVAARTAIAAFYARKAKAAARSQEARSAAASQIEFRIATQVKSFLRGTSPGMRAARADAIVHQLSEAILTLLPDYMGVEGRVGARPRDSRGRDSCFDDRGIIAVSSQSDANSVSQGTPNERTSYTIISSRQGSLPFPGTFAPDSLDPSSTHPPFHSRMDGTQSHRDVYANSIYKASYVGAQSSARKR
jgi:hypothetical protein